MYITVFTVFCCIRCLYALHLNKQFQVNRILKTLELIRLVFHFIIHRRLCKKKENRFLCLELKVKKKIC